MSALVRKRLAETGFGIVCFSEKARSADQDSAVRSTVVPYPETITLFSCSFLVILLM
jgi:hypothetical protein